MGLELTVLDHLHLFRFFQQMGLVDILWGPRLYGRFTTTASRDGNLVETASDVMFTTARGVYAFITGTGLEY